MQIASAVLHRIKFFPCADLWFQRKQLRIYFWNIKTSPELIQLLLYWPEYDDLLFFSLQTSWYKYKHSYLHHDISLLEYKVFSRWTVIETSSRLLALQAYKHFQTFISFTVFVFLFHFHSLSCTKPKLAKRFFKEDMDKCYC